jgi:chemotaxis protein histidine kinase CheA
MIKTREDTKKYAQLHGIVSEMHQLEVRLYEMLETWDFKNSDEYWRLADQFRNLNTQLNRSVWKEHQDR